MKIAILKVILWPKDENHSPKIVHFQPGKINVITGQSGTGKSTLTWLIDYCLGSDKCAIPVGLIRNVTGWFGLHLKLANTEMIVARRNPENQQSTSDIFLAEGLSVAVPQRVEKNARVEDLKNRFNQLGQLPNLEVTTEDMGRASFRDMAAFNFQPQHIVANPHTLFFKADTMEHREKLRVVFPLALGAVDATTLSKQRELKDAEREYERLQRELNARLNAAKAWEAEVESYYVHARGLGLLPDSAVPSEGWPLEKYVLELQKVPEMVRKSDIPDIQEGTNARAARDLTDIVNEEDRLAQELGSTRRRLAQVEQLSSSVGEYRTVLTTQEDRMQGVGWFEAKLKKRHECPVCAAVHENGNPRLDELVALAGELKTLTSSFQQAPAKLDHEVASLREDLRQMESALSKVRQKRKGVEEQSQKQSQQRQQIRQIYLFVGRVEQALENVRNSQNLGDTRQRVEKLTAKIRSLKGDLDPSRQQTRIEAAVSAVSTKIANYARELRLEHAEENVRLNIRELTLQFSPLSGRQDFLWELGSGQNWVGYHIAALLALHEHFVTLPNNPVPRFLVIDQPSQVYFPEAWPSIEEAPSEITAQKQSADIEGVKRIFAALSHFMDITEQHFQVIVTEHAGSMTWSGLKNVHLVGNWREGKDEYLVPAEWLAH